MKQKSTQLLQDLEVIIRQMIAVVEKEFAPLSPETLRRKPAPDKWSIAECLEHLNLYGDYYIPAIDRAIALNPGLKNREYFKSGWLGNYFAMSMLPKENGKLMMMKSPKDKNPAATGLPADVVLRFIEQQDEFLSLLSKASHTDLEKVRIPITIAPWIKLKLGDTFRFNIYHEQRHIMQAQNVLRSIAAAQ